MANLDERDWYPAIIDGARRRGVLLCRIADAPATGKKPFDLFGITSRGIGVAIEAKMVRSSKNLWEDGFADAAARSLRSHQSNWLQAWAGCGGVALLIAARKEDPERAVALLAVDESGVLNFRRIGVLYLSPNRSTTTGWEGCFESLKGLFED